MRILVYDVAADSGGAVTVLKSFYEEFCRDTENEYVFVLSVFELPDRTYPGVELSLGQKKSIPPAVFRSCTGASSGERISDRPGAVSSEY